MGTPSRTAALADMLRAQIAEGALPPGQKLPSEAQLIAEHAVSRTVVREALGRLQAEGLIHTRRGAGSYALTPPIETTTPAAQPVRTAEDRLHLIEFRLAVETQAAALAAERRTRAQLDALRSELEACSAAEKNPAKAMQHDFRFHRILAEASGNPFFLNALDGLGSAMITMPRTRITGTPDPKGPGEPDPARADRLAAAPGDPTKRATSEPEADRAQTGETAPNRTAQASATATSSHQQAAQEHGQILAAVATEDSRAAAAAMHLHLSSSRRRLFNS